MNKKILGMLISVLSLSFLCSCMNAIPELSDEENIMVVRYMADAVLENDKFYEERLLSDEEVELQLIEEQKKAEELKKIEEEEAQKKAEEEAANVPDEIEIKEAKKKYYDSDLAGYLELEGLNFEYTGYRFTDRMPEDDSVLSFVVAPSSPGNTILVIEFDIINQTSSDINLMFPTDSKIKAVINNKKKVSPMMTFLEEDLYCNLERLIPANGSAKAFVCFEIPKSEEINELGIQVSYNGKENIKINL